MSDESAPPPPPIPPTPPAAPLRSTAAPTSASAIWSLVLGVLSFLCGAISSAIPAVICGHVARSKIRKSGGAFGGIGIATVGLILGYIAVALNIMGLPCLLA